MKLFDTFHTDNESYQQGEKLFRRGSVSVSPSLGRERALLYGVGSTPAHTVTLFANGDFSCTCGAADTLCSHAVAAILKSREDGRLVRMQQENELALGEQMLVALSRAMPGGETIRLQATLRLYGDGRVGLGLSAGQERLYAVKNIADLLTCYALGANLPLSEKFSYRPGMMRFSREDERLLTLLMNHIPLKARSLRDWEDGVVIDYEERERGPAYDGRFVLITGALLHSALRYFETHSFILVMEDQKQPQSGIRTLELPLCFSVALSPTELTVQAEGAESLRLITPDGRYVLYEGRVVHLHSAQARVCRLLCSEGPAFRYPARDAEDTLAMLLPALNTVGTVAPSPELGARLITAPFKAAAYLDLVNGNVEARVEFHYGETVLHPFSQEMLERAEEAENSSAPLRAAAPTLEDGRLLLRDGRAESELLNFFSDAGFSVRSGRIVLKRSRDILSFCTQGVGELAKLCEVYASTAFEKVKPRRLSARASFHMRGGRLVFALLEEGEAMPEVLPILQAVAQRQQYVRLKTGEFLDVRDLSGLAPVVQELLDAAALDDPHADIEARELSFGAYRAAYMVSMLRMAGAKAETDAEVEAAMNALSDSQPAVDRYVSAKLQRKLQDYQKRGAGWLFSLYEARMGGILADEMGLGKTVQIIAALSAAKRRDGTQKSIIVTPTSLTYHWLAELKRFDDQLVVRVITGARDERRQAIETMKKEDDVDVILTSYPLLRRDIDYLKDFPLRFAVLDEAQSVKNAQSLGAVAAKELDAQVRIALTGTPMENHTGELWSIFDFILPGYLGTQASFLRRYGGGEHAEELRERIRPFLMRRLKDEVLKDLPKKHEQSLYAAMTPEQSRVYDSLMQTLRQHVGQALQEGSLPRARMQVLSILLKLRQVCCHPKLFLADYEGTSGKLELLVQTVHTAIASKRRMLIFSQFVGMLQIIRKRLSREGVQCLYLDGETKPEQRQQLCDRFNGGE
ncbi:MAG: SNF2 helicase associated domain-containing protein, partial [Clostridia bacterium]|nr:SNF2 helicase associated domain-containing protein [Clostridia bacterium]